MQTTSFRIWTRVAESIPNDNNGYATSASTWQYEHFKSSKDLYLFSFYQSYSKRNYFRFYTLSYNLLINLLLIPHRINKSLYISNPFFMNYPLYIKKSFFINKGKAQWLEL